MITSQNFGAGEKSVAAGKLVEKWLKRHKATQCKTAYNQKRLTAKVKKTKAKPIGLVKPDNKKLGAFESVKAGKARISQKVYF